MRLETDVEVFEQTTQSPKHNLTDTLSYLDLETCVHQVSDLHPIQMSFSNAARKQGQIYLDPDVFIPYLSECVSE